MENDHKGSGFFFGGFLLGAVIGAVAALILSQKEGKERLQVRISDFAGHAKQTIKEAIEEGKQAACRREAEIRGDQTQDDE